MSRSRKACASLIVRFTLFVVALLTGAATVGAIPSLAADVARYAPPPPPAISAKAVYVTDMSTGTDLFAQNAEEPLPPASLTKIVSALVILEEADLEVRIEIVPEDLVSPEESQVGLVAGDVLSARDLLFGVLIPSGNDATLALARHIGSTRLGASATPEQAVEEFVRLMNVKAEELGATASHFVNPTGIDGEGHVMSAQDLATLTEAALQNPLFAEIVSTPSAVLESEVLPDGYPVTTTNLLLLEGAVQGVKTGSTPKAGGCLVTAFRIGSNEVVAVVLGSDQIETPDGLQDNSARFSDTRTLIAATTDEYLWIDPAAPGEVAGLLDELLVWDVRMDDPALLPVPATMAGQVRYRLVLDPPVDSNEAVGEVQFFVGERLLSMRPALQAG